MGLAHLWRSMGLSGESEWFCEHKLHGFLPLTEAFSPELSQTRNEMIYRLGTPRKIPGKIPGRIPPSQCATVVISIVSDAREQGRMGSGFSSEIETSTAL